MGLFNFFYKLTNILSNKRKLRVFIIIVLIFIIIFCWSRGVFAVESADNDQFIMDYQLILQQNFTSYFRYWCRKKPVDYSDSKRNDILNRFQYNCMYCTVPPGQSNELLYVYSYVPNNNYYHNNSNVFTIDGTWSVGFNSGTQFDCKLGYITPNAFLIISIANGVFSIDYNNSPNLSDVLMPSSCYDVRSSSLDLLLKDFNMSSSLPTTYNTNDDELQSLTQSGFANQVNAINNVNSSVQDVNSSVEDVNQSVMEMIDTITAPYVNVSQDQLPTQSVNDTTEAPLNSLFDYIKDAFTGEPTAFSFPMPFVRW